MPMYFKLRQLRKEEKVGERLPKASHRFLLIEANIYNYGESDITLHDTDFEISYEAESTQFKTLPSVELMKILKETMLPNLEYPDYDRLLYPDFVVPRKKSKQTVLVFELHDNVDFFSLAFISDDAELNFVILPVENSETYLTHKMGTNDQVNYEIDFDSFEQRVSKILDTEDIAVDNCYGTATITRTVEFSKESTTNIIIEDERRFHISPQFFPYVGRLVNFQIRNRYQTESGEKIVQNRTENLAASPNTKPKWRLTWYLETIEGTVLLQLGDEVYELPYSVTERLRSDLVSLPSDPCEAINLTPTQ